MVENLKARPLSGKFALVTGSTRHIGRQIAIALAEAGVAGVAIHGRQKEDCLRVAGEVEAMGGHAIVVPGDISDPPQIEGIVQGTLAGFGRLDILINNAGGSLNPMEPFWETTLDRWRYQIDINLTATFLFSKLVAPHMIGQGSGRIVNVSSGQARRTALGRTAYGTAKAGVEQFTRCAAASLGPYGIRVNCIAPGAITLAHNPSPHQVTPLGYQGVPEDIAGVVVFLCSQEASYLTGQIITVDGGRDCLAPSG